MSRNLNSKKTKPKIKLTARFIMQKFSKYEKFYKNLAQTHNIMEPKVAGFIKICVPRCKTVS